MSIKEKRRRWGATNPSHGRKQPRYHCNLTVDGVGAGGGLAASLLITLLPPMTRFPPRPCVVFPEQRLLVNFDCSALWVKKSACVVDALSVKQDILYSKGTQGGQVADFKDWQVREPLQEMSGAMHGTNVYKSQHIAHVSDQE